MWFDVQIGDNATVMAASGFVDLASKASAGDWSRDIGKQPILDLCGDLHASNIGTGDLLSDDDQRVIRRILNDRLKHWTPVACSYDSHVRALIVSVLREPDNLDRQWSYLYQGHDTPKPW